MQVSHLTAEDEVNKHLHHQHKPIYVHEAQSKENENKVATALGLRMVRTGLYCLKYGEKGGRWEGVQPEVKPTAR